MKVLKNSILGTVSTTLVGTARIGIAFVVPAMVTNPIGIAVFVSTLLVGVALTGHSLYKSLTEKDFVSSTKNN